MKLHRPRLSVATKVFLICVGLALAASIGGGSLIYHGASEALRMEVRHRIQSVARTVASQVDADLHAKIQDRGDESAASYAKIKALLTTIRKANPDIRYVYTMRPTKRSNTWKFVVDTEKNPKLVSHVGDDYNISSCPNIRDSLVRSTSDEQPIQDEWGTWLSGYAPIKYSNGRTESVVGLDMSLEELRRKESAIRSTAVKSAITMFLVAILLSLLVTKAVLRPMHLFTTAAERVRSGDLDFQLPVKGADEISEFGKALNQMIVGLREGRERLMEQSSRDFVTGLFNHGYFQERLSVEMERAGKFQRQLCLLLVDIDRFKSINDNLGHPVGDNILRQLGKLLATSMRKIDVAARYGGDEFALILPETDIEAGLQLAELVRAKVESHCFQAPTLGAQDDPANSDVTITVTMGLAAFPDHHTSRDGLIMTADIALCRAKHVCRNSVSLYDPKAGGDYQVDPQYLYHILRDPNTAAIESLASAIDEKQRSSNGHSDRVTDYALDVAAAVGLPVDELDALKIAGMLHDLGKIGVPDSILNKNGGLTQEEMEVIRQHPSVGGSILHRTPQLGTIVPAVMFHHERWDGSGYPNGLAGDQIPLMARILAIADAFDAMTSNRPYRKAMSVEDALLELRANAGKQFDPGLVEAFVSHFSQESERKAA